MRFFLVTILIFAAAPGAVFAAGGKTAERPEFVADPVKAAEHLKYADILEKQAEVERAAGNTELADLLQKRAAAGKIIADGYAKGDKALVTEGFDKYRDARESISLLRGKSTRSAAAAEKAKAQVSEAVPGKESGGFSISPPAE